MNSGATIRSPSGTRGLLTRLAPMAGNWPPMKRGVREIHSIHFPRSGLRLLKRAICSLMESRGGPGHAQPDLHDLHLVSEQPWHILQSGH